MKYNLEFFLFVSFTWYQSKNDPLLNHSFLYFPIFVSMAKDEKKSNSNSSYSLHHSSHPEMVLVSKPLDGDNFSTWHRAMVISLNAKSKLGFVDGTLKAPFTNDKLEEYVAWKKCNNMVLLGSLIL